MENGKQYEMLTPFPRQPIAQDQFSRTLQDLQLVPNAVIVLQAPVVQESKSESFFVWLWNMIINFFFMFRRVPPAPVPSESNKKQEPKKQASERWDNGNSTQVLSKDDKIE
jgi:hypothetical protein